MSEPLSADERAELRAAALFANASERQSVLGIDPVTVLRLLDQLDAAERGCTAAVNRLVNTGQAEDFLDGLREAERRTGQRYMVPDIVRPPA